MTDARSITPFAIAIAAAGLALCGSDALADSRGSPRRPEHALPAVAAAPATTHIREPKHVNSVRPRDGIVHPPGITHRPYHPHVGKGAYICDNSIHLPHSP